MRLCSSIQNFHKHFKYLLLIHSRLTTLDFCGFLPDMSVPAMSLFWADWPGWPTLTHITSTPDHLLVPSSATIKANFLLWLTGSSMACPCHLWLYILLTILLLHWTPCSLNLPDLFLTQGLGICYSLYFCVPPKYQSVWCPCLLHIFVHISLCRRHVTTALYLVTLFRCACRKSLY